VISLLDGLFVVLQNELYSVKADIKRLVNRIAILQGVSVNINFMKKHADWFYVNNFDVTGIVWCVCVCVRACVRVCMCVECESACA